MISLKNWQGIAAVIGVDWGDSGKGRLVDDLAVRAHIIARYNGGANTSHTVKNKYGKFAFHIMPSGIFNKKATCLVGRGVAIDLESLIEDEFEQLKKAKVSWKNLKVDEQASLVMPWHKMRDGIREELRGGGKIGTTRRGVGPAYADRVERSGLRVKDLYDGKFAEKLKEELEFQNKIYDLTIPYKEVLAKYTNYAKIIKPLVARTILILKEAQKARKNILFEGAQAYFLDIDFGTYPCVTSSNTGVLGIWRSFEIYPTDINHVIGITKAYMTRVGKGPMPTKIEGSQREIIIEKGGEIGTTSGRIRDPGWLDLVLVKAACGANKVNRLALTKIDILSGFKNIKICVGYKINGKAVDYVSGDAAYLSWCKPVYETLPGWQEDISQIRDFKKLPKNAQNYIRKIEKFVGVPIEFISVGPQRGEVIYV